MRAAGETVELTRGLYLHSVRLSALSLPCLCSDLIRFFGRKEVY